MKMRQNVIQVQIMHYENKTKCDTSADYTLERQEEMQCKYRFYAGKTESNVLWGFAQLTVDFWWGRLCSSADKE